MKYSYLHILIWLIALPLAAQETPRGALAKAQALHRAYRFEEAEKAYGALLEGETRPDAREQLSASVLDCRNGAALARYICRPRTLAKWPVTAADFYLRVQPGEGAVWTTPPASLLQALAHTGEPQPFLYQSHLDRLIFAARDSLSRRWDLYEARRRSDSLWSAPEKMDARINSAGNECFPLLSADGKTLYFSSDGRGGMGGADLYRSRLSAQGEWSPAENLGIPWSSPADDWLYLPDPAQGTVQLISKRETEGGKELTLYILEHLTSPVQRTPENLAELQRVASLTPEAVPVTSPTAGAEEAASRPRDPAYAAALEARAEALKAVSETQDRLDTWRKLYGEIKAESDRKALERDLAQGEESLWELQAQLKRASHQVLEEEERLVAEGRQGEVVAGEAKGWAPQVTEEAKPAYKPVKPEKGALAQVTWARFETPEPVTPPVDLSFRKEKVAEFVTFESLPQELFYRIQILTAGSKVAANRLKGLSPAFEIRSGRSYIYHVGFFSTFAEANKALPEVKRAGFGSAFVFAYYRGQRISTQEARKLEARGTGSYRILLGDFPQGLSAELREAVSQVSTKDLSKSVEEGRTLYYLGPFGTLTEAENVLDALHSQGFTDTKIE